MCSLKLVTFDNGKGLKADDPLHLRHQFNPSTRGAFDIVHTLPPDVGEQHAVAPSVSLFLQAGAMMIPAVHPFFSKEPSDFKVNKFLRHRCVFFVFCFFWVKCVINRGDIPRG